MTFIDDARLTATDDRTFVATLSPTWTSMIGIHGGYTAAIATQAVLRTADGERSLRNLDVQFLRPPAVGELTIHVEPVSVGRTMSFLRATATQGGKPVSTCTAVLGTDRDGLEFDDLPRPTAAGAPPPSTARRFVAPEPGQHFEQLDLRLEPGLTLFGGHDTARVAGWLRPLDPEESVSTPWLVCAADFMPPSMVFRTDRPVQAASIDLSIQFVAPTPDALVPAGSPIYLESTTTVSSGGFLVEDGTMWSPAGTILATTRQLRLAGI